MSRKYIKIKELKPQILAMRAAGKTRREIAEAFELEKVQIKSWINRHNKEQQRREVGILPKKKGRPRKNAEPTSPEEIIREQAYEIKRLKMENELLRDFLQSVGRK